ncbi:hypothetical protein CPB85DRAFT_995307 [Mucidula mucida]|nr:hypothetical protein CPB85DRAFT_995307 [Mucidula mucida]
MNNLIILINSESTFDISDLSNAFVASLSDVSSPTHCATFYVQYLEFLCGDQLASVMRSNRHDVFNTCMRFLTHSRTDEELHKLERSILKCSCDPKHRCVHESGRTKPARWNPTLQGVFEGCAIVVRLCFGPFDSNGTPVLLTLDQAMKQSKKAEKKGQKALWPLAARDILVNSPEQTLSVMWRLCYRYKSDPILASLQNILHASGSTLSSLVYKMPAFPGQFLHYFEAELAKLALGGQDLGPLSTVILMLHQSTLKCFELHDINAFFFWIPHAHGMLKTLTRAVSVLAPLPSSIPERDQMLKCLDGLGYGFIVYFRQHLPRDLSSYCPKFVQVYHRLSTSMPDNEKCSVRAFTRVQELAVSDRCSGPRCTETTATQSRKLQACSGCSVTRYCSLECQKAGWKDKNVPHKSICGLLQVFQQKTGVSCQQLKATHYTEEEMLAIVTESKFALKDASEISEQLRLLAMWRDARHVMESLRLP